MPIIKNEKKELIYFVHIPKAAGSSLGNAIREFYDIGLFSKNKQFMDITPQHLDREQIEYINLNKLIDHSFTVTRHPMDRIISEYKYRSNNRSILLRNLLDFDSFVYYCFNEYKKNKNVLGGHIKPQVEFILKDTRIFKLEEGFDNVIDYLRDVCSLEKISDVSRVNISEPKNIHMTKRTQLDIENFYADDYRYFNYDKTIPSIKNRSIVTIKIKVLAYKSITKLSGLWKRKK